MSRRAFPGPSIDILERGGRVIAIRVRHAGRVPPLPPRFSPDVVRRALSLSRTRFEHRVLTAARRLGRVAYRIVERSLIIERCERIEERLVAQREARRLNPAPASRRIMSGNSAPRPPSLTELWSRGHGVDPAQLSPAQDRGRGR
mgnify:FL=1